MEITKRAALVSQVNQCHMKIDGYWKCERITEDQKKMVDDRITTIEANTH